MTVIVAVVVGSLSMAVGVFLGALLSAARMADLEDQIGRLYAALDDDPVEDEVVERFVAQLDDWDGDPDEV